MKPKKILFTFSFLFINLISFCQQIGDGLAPVIPDFTIPLRSGVYNGLNAVGAMPDNSHPWQHLFVMRHPNVDNNHQLQISSSFVSNDRLFFRKIAADLNSTNPTWIELATRGANSFIGDQNIVGNVAIDSKLYVKENGTSNSIWRGRIVASGEINAVVMGEYNGKAWLGAHNSQLNGWSDLIIQADGGNVGIGATTPAAKLHIQNAGINGQLDYNLIVQKTLVADSNKSAVGLLFSTEGYGSFGKSAIVHERTGGYGIGNLYFLNNNAVDSSNPTLLDAKMVINSNGYVGIGTQNPIGKFDVRGNVFIGTTDLSIGSVGSFVQIDQGSSTGNSYSQIRAYSNGGNINNHLVLQSTGGNVGIGSTNPDQKLTVKGKIHAEEIIVDLAVPADYVFQKYYTGKSTLKSDYVMPTLAEIESFTKKNHHLPNVPSAQEVQQNGVSLGTMSNVLLQKVEELTLYAIEQNKELERLKKENNVQSNEIKTLKKENEMFIYLSKRLTEIENQLK